jgi:uncharacterized protein YbjQ (UPF0145 family)
MRVSKQPRLKLVLTAGALVALSFIPTQRVCSRDDDTLPTLAPPVAPIMVTTTDSFEGYRVREYKGIVRGVTVRVPGPMSSFKANIKSMVGGKISPYMRMCEEARQQAMDMMIERAQAVGANAVLAFRYDSSSYGESDEMGTEVVCYGTAVVIGPRDLKAAILP